MEKWQVVRNRKLYIKVFICIEIICCAVALLLATQGFSNAQNEYMLKIDAQIEELRSYVSTELSNCVNTGNAIFSSVWYQHLTNRIDIYKEEFTPLRQSEIISDLSTKTAGQRYLKNIVVVVPEKNVVIDKQLFTNLDNYFDIYKDFLYLQPDEKNTKYEFVSNSNTNGIWVLKRYRDYVRRNDLSAVVLVFDLNTMSNAIQTIASDDITELVIHFGADIIYNRKNQDSDFTKEIRFVQPDLTINVGFRTFYSLYFQNYVWLYTFCILLVSIISAVAAEVVLRVCYIPLQKTMKKYKTAEINVAHNSTVLEEIEAFLQQFEAKKQSLQSREKAVEAIMLDYDVMLREHVLTYFLENVDEKSFDLNKIIPEFANGHCCIMLVSAKEVERFLSKATTVCVKSKINYEIENVSVYDEINVNRHTCFILWYRDFDEALEGQKRLENAFAAHASDIRCSDVLCTFVEIRRAYVDLSACLDKNENERLVDAYKLIMSLVYANEKEDKELSRMLIQKARSQCDAYFVMQLIDKRYQSAVDTTWQNTTDEDAVWEMILEKIKVLSDDVLQRPKREPSKNAVQILEYIHNNYPNPELSLEQVAEQFGVNGKKVTQLIKDCTGVGFIEYLTEQRICKACELMKNENVLLKDVAEKTGYMNYVSFNRAFQRHTGTTPMEYRKGLKESQKDDQ